MTGPAGSGAAGLLFSDALACEECRPAAFLPVCADPRARQAACVRAEALLQAIAVVEDSRAEEPDEHGPTALALGRIEARLDLLTTLVASLARRDGGDAWVGVRWSALGASLPATHPVEPGTVGLFRIQPCDWLPESLELPATVIERDADTLWLRFDPVTPGLTAALERHLFRVHRREIAGRRRDKGAA